MAQDPLCVPVVLPLTDLGRKPCVCQKIRKAVCRRKVPLIEETLKSDFSAVGSLETNISEDVNFLKADTYVPAELRCLS